MLINDNSLPNFYNTLFALWVNTVNSLLVDTSVKWTSGDGPCVSLLPLFDSLQEGRLLVLVPMVFVLGRVNCIVYQQQHRKVLATTTLT